MKSSRYLECTQFILYAINFTCLKVYLSLRNMHTVYKSYRMHLEHCIARDLQKVNMSMSMSMIMKRKVYENGTIKRATRSVLFLK